MVDLSMRFTPSRASFPADVDEFPDVLSWVQSVLVDAKEGGPPFLRRVGLALEEAFVNIAHHAYTEKKGGKVEIELSPLPDGVRVSLSDEGPPFDPLQQGPPVDRRAPLEERKEGGLGIVFIQSMADEIHYARRGRKNCLELTFTASRSKRK